MKPRRPSSATIIAFAALFVLLSSTAVAAGLRKNSVTNRSIKKNAVTGAKVKNSSLTGADIKSNSLTGSDIDESTLQTVPNAGSIGGIPAAKLTTDDTIVKFNVPMNRGDGARTLFTAGPFTLTASCYANGVGFDVRAEVTTSVNDTWAAWDSDYDAGVIHYIGNVNAASATARARQAGAIDVHDPATGIAVQGTVYEFYGFPNANCRYVGLLSVERP